MFEAVIFDYARTIADPETSQLFPEAEAVLLFFKKNVAKMALVSRGQDVDQRLKDFETLDLKRYFDAFSVVGPGGTKDFTSLLKELEVTSPEKCLIIGDRVKSEILEGNKLGCKTVWVKQGKFAAEEPENEIEQPDYIVMSLSELPDLFERIAI